MKHFMTCMMLLCSSASFAANSLLKSHASGALPAQSTINSIGIISNSTDVALVLGNTGHVSIIDIADAKLADAAANTITSVPNFAASKLDALAGKKVTVIDMVVNPRSRAVYILGRSSATAYYVFKVTNKGNTVTMMNLNSVTYSQVNITNNYRVNSIAWGDNTLYVSAGSGSLNAELDYMKPPYAHNAAFTKQLTSMFQTNFGSRYVTSAPLERMGYGEVKGVKRLAGVTTCAPGFSLDLAKVSGSGTVQITEDFNVEFGMPSKVMLLTHDSKSWLYDLHDVYGGSGFLYRIGEKYLDGSQVTANKVNQNVQKLRTTSGAIKTGLTDADVKLVGKYVGAAMWDNGRLLLLEPETAGGALKLMIVGSIPTPAGVSGVSIQPLSLAPNPAQQSVTLRLPEDMQAGTAVITAMDGRVVRREQLRQSSSTIALAGIPAGTYTVQVSDGSQQAAATLQVQ